MANVQELKGVVRETLEQRGVLGQVKARLRAEVFKALDDQGESRPPLSNENLLINELIRDYLLFNGYSHSASVLEAESGQPCEPLQRDFLARELHITEDKESASVPLMYGILSHFLNRGGSKSRQGHKSFLPEADTPHQHEETGAEEATVMLSGER